MMRYFTVYFSPLGSLKDEGIFQDSIEPGISGSGEK